MYTGVGARRIRDLFANARASVGHQRDGIETDARCAIIFIDEIDAVGAKRGFDEAASKRMTINQLLTEMDGFASNANNANNASNASNASNANNQKVIVIAATNNAESLDPALVRSGRFDKTIHVSLPDMQGRQDILKLYLGSKSVSRDVNVATLAKETESCSGADLYNIVNTAALKSIELRESGISKASLNYARDIVLHGSRPKIKLDESIRHVTAVHESGHAIMALLTNTIEPTSISITPRGSSLGRTETKINSKTRTKAELLSILDISVAGGIAEQIKFGSEHVPTGLADDLRKATDLARTMVMEYGMSSPRVEPMSGKYSEQTESMRVIIDQEVSKFLFESRQRVLATLTQHSSALDKLSKKLLECETIDLAQIKSVVRL
jgi:ATP-dependent metalloprotease